MIVAHGLWWEGRLAVWAEDPSAGSPFPGPVPPVTSDGIGRHPSAAAVETLLAEVGAGEPGTLELLLPGDGRRPYDSPDVFREPVETDGSPAAGPTLLGRWAVPAVAFDADEALSMLRDLPASGITMGASLRHLVALAEFAADIVARGRILPSLDVLAGDGRVVDAAEARADLERAAGGGRAVWRPVLTDTDRRRAQEFAASLPPSGRCAVRPESIVDAGSPATGMPAAAAVVSDALDALVDATARAFLPSTRRTPKDWRSALTGRRREFPAAPEDLVRLAAELAAWQRDAAGGAVRALFRLVEPPKEAGDDEPWRVELSLQAADEPSLVVGAADIWAGTGAFARHLDAPQETFLGELGRAARLWPDLDRALSEAKPAILDLDATRAHAFLRDAAPLLAGAGFGVLLPRWWGKPAARIGVKLTASSPAAPATVANKSTVGLEAMVDYEWELALGEHTLTQEELERLAGLKAPLVRVRGQWVELDPKRLAAGLALLADQGQMTVLDLLTGRAASDVELPVVEVAATGWVGDLLTGQQIPPAELTDAFTGTLRPYQLRGVSWLCFLERLGLGAVLADDMGLGKTAQILALASTAGEGGKTLIVCPMSLVGNWQREAAKFAPALRVHVHHGAERVQGKKFTDAVEASDLVVTTYSLATRDAAALRRIGWHRIVVDEAQAIKNAATKQAVAIRSLPALHRVAVTGTPVENRLADLWSIMEFANPGLLGPAAEFKRAYAEPIQRHGDELAADRLRRLTAPFVLRRLKTDKTIITDLPEKLEMEVVCNLTTEQATLYQAVVDDALRAIENAEGIERRGLVLATMTKLKQVCNHPAQLLRDGSRLAGRSGKLARLEEILEEVLAAGEKALLFTQYAEFGGALQGHLSGRFGREVLYLHGGVSKPDRDAMVERFQADGGPSVFVLSLKAGGTGLTLTAANHVVHVDRWWNPAVEDQATDRAFRIGQRRNVQVRKFVCAGTLEEKIAALIRDKRELADRIVGTGEGWLTELSTAELKDLFRLETNAAVE
ncbi:SNF2-related protein [Hamadaea tsunoensis]|uniref:SNF2-related protein n=1 Tax=Hamadaea tsunoensis TaxID=53368 RepID=UPI00047F0D32|nr:SNF2-related protein [Hamadaea tsunoensis]